ncbi:hypothetical protein EDC44_13720, partial [Cricetibacter osteomyelitidis]
MYDKIASVKKQSGIHPVGSPRWNKGSNLPNVAFRKEIRAGVKMALEQEANEINGDLTKPLNYLRPWSHYRRFEPEQEYFKHIVDVLTELLFNNWTTTDTAVRAA